MRTETRPPQSQTEPGFQHRMQPRPIEIRENYRGSDKLKGKTALITGGDSGIGRSVALHFAREGADIAVVYLSEDEDAEETKKKVEAEGRRCLLIKCDVGDESACREAASRAVAEFGHLDVLVNNAAEQHPKESIEQISAEQLEDTFRTNVFGMFYMTKACLPHLANGAAIINTTSVTNYKGSKALLDYSATKGAVTAFTRSLSQALVDRHIRVNGVAPGPIWTPLIVSTFKEDEIPVFGNDTPMKRAGQPAEVAPCYVFLASDDSSYMTGQVLHPNGGTVVNT
ncbi:MAG TPA: SDR family oxidoreductase [Fimbriimonadaceae bacterium]|nr:SDR family oxidoreductase [Fimbriimonadaceae bacterium]